MYINKKWLHSKLFLIVGSGDTAHGGRPRFVSPQTGYNFMEGHNIACNQKLFNHAASLPPGRLTELIESLKLSKKR